MENIDFKGMLTTFVQLSKKHVFLSCYVTVVDGAIQEVLGISCSDSVLDEKDISEWIIFDSKHTHIKFEDGSYPISAVMKWDSDDDESWLEFAYVEVDKSISLDTCHVCEGFGESMGFECDACSGTGKVTHV